jgi:mycothiol synthase
MLTMELEQTAVLPAGFTARPVTMEDLTTAVALFNACSLVQMGRETYTTEEIGAEWGLEDFDLDRSTQAVFAPDGKLVGYMEVWDTSAVPVSPWVWGRIHPDFEGLGLGTFLLEWAESRARQVFGRVQPEARVAMRCGHLSTHAPSQELLAGYGMIPTRSFWTMVIDLDGEPETAVFPPNIRITTLAEWGDLTAVLLASDDAFKDHWGYVEQPQEEMLSHWQKWLATDPGYDPALWYLALDGDEVAGVSLCRLKAHEDPNMGWVDTLGVRRPWRRRGIADALLRHSFRELYRLGQRAVGLGVDADSLTGATRLYEQAGMYVKRQFINYEKELRPGLDLTRRNLE